MFLQRLLRRFLIYRLLRYRFAWFAFSLLAFYLMGTLALVSAAREQATVRGELASCALEAGSSGAYRFTLRQEPDQQFRLSTADVRPALPADLCATADDTPLTVGYETGLLDDARSVDWLTVGAGTPAAVTYRDESRGDFALRKWLETAVIGGATGFVAVALLGGALLWPRIEPLLLSARSAEMATSARRSRTPKRRLPTVRLAPPAAFLAQVDEDVHWLDALPWGDGGDASSEASREAFWRVLDALRVWDGDEEVLMGAIRALVACPPPLALAGAAAVALQMARYTLTTYAPAGVACAERFVARALQLAPAVVEARAIQFEVAIAQALSGDPDAYAQAQASYEAARRTETSAARLATMRSSLQLVAGAYHDAGAELVEALRLATRPTEREACAHAVEQLAVYLQDRGERRAARVLRVARDAVRSDRG